MTIYSPGSLCWVDLGTSDPAAAARFYSGLLGWDVGAPAEGGYRMCRVDGNLVGALAHDRQPDPWWTTNVSVADIERAARDVVQAGGEIYSGPGTIGTQGRFASATDPIGTKILLWEPLDSTGAELRGVASAWVRTILFAPQWSEVQRFYEKAFGWQSAGPRRDGAVELCTRDEQPVASCHSIPTGWPSTRRSLWVSFFGVMDLDAAIDRAVNLGARVCTRANPEPGLALLVDDQGALFGLETMDESRAPKAAGAPGASKH
jgi:predicted enzyme related to lactoylglutathione lyase